LDRWIVGPFCRESGCNISDGDAVYPISELFRCTSPTSDRDPKDGAVVRGHETILIRWWPLNYSNTVVATKLF
jgi:hypothetical protein